MSKPLSHKELLGALEGREIRLDWGLFRYETELGVVSVIQGQIWADGAIIDPNPSDEALHELISDLFYDEFGTHNPREVLW